MEIKYLKVGDYFRHKHDSHTDNMSSLFEIRGIVDKLYVIRTHNKRKKRYDYNVVNSRYFDTEIFERLT